jgi:hypothetical protein
MKMEWGDNLLLPFAFLLRDILAPMNLSSLVKMKSAGLHSAIFCISMLDYRTFISAKKGMCVGFVYEWILAQ